MISFGQPGQLRKTFNDKIFDLLSQVSGKVGCKLDALVDPAVAVVDGKFLSPNGAGEFEASPDADRPCYMVFTAHTEVITKIVTPADDFPGEDRTDTPTGLYGEILGIWPKEILDLVTNAGGGGLAAYVANAPLTVRAGVLSLAGAGEKVVGYVEAPSSVVGADSVAARIRI